MRNQKYDLFYNYLLELCEDYHKNKNSRGISLIASKHKIGALTNAQFYDVFKLANPELHPEDFEDSNGYLPTKKYAMSVRDAVLKYNREQALLRREGKVKEVSKEDNFSKFRVTVSPITNWIQVSNAARFTRRRELVDEEPCDEFKKKIVIAEHSPLRALMFYIDFYDIPYYVAMHFRTHKLVHLPLVSTSRPDVDDNMKPREEQMKTDLVNMRLMLDAQEIIAISRVRLCNKAEVETRKIWAEAINELKKTEPILASACVPSCIYKGFCPEIESCKFVNTDKYDEAAKEYIHKFVVDNSK